MRIQRQSQPLSFAMAPATTSAPEPWQERRASHKSPCILPQDAGQWVFAAGVVAVMARLLVGSLGVWPCGM